MHKNLIKLYFSPDYTVVYSTHNCPFFQLLLDCLTHFLDNTPNLNVILC